MSQNAIFGCISDIAKSDVEGWKSADISRNHWGLSRDLFIF